MTTARENHRSTFSLLLKVFFHLSPRRRIQFGLILLVMLTSGIAELVSLGAVLPFLTVISSPDRLLGLDYLQYLSAWNIFSKSSALVLLVTIVFGLSTLLAMLIRLANLWVNTQFVAAIGSDLSIDAFQRTLYQPYESHLHRNSSTLVTSMTAHISRSVTALGNVLQMATASVVVVFIFGGLLYINWLITLLSAVTISAVYMQLGLTARRKLESNSRSISTLTEKQVKSIQESLGSIRDVILDSSQKIFLIPYGDFDRTKRQKQATNIFLGSFPRFVIETFGILLIISIGAFLALKNNNSEAIVPLLGVIALGAQRLLPSLQQIYAGWCNLKNFTADLDGLCILLDQKLPLHLVKFEPIDFQKSISLSDINFSYGTSYPKVLMDVNVNFRRGERIGLIGTSGSGKSTLVDLLMGLLKPSIGQICVDGLSLYDDSKKEILLKWRASIAHVPQTIYLSDASIVQNIAFGETKDQIDLSRIIESAKMAQIHDYIISIPQGYESYVGERGIRLSGGQKQRLGIARALYKKSQILVLDEATSALDDVTEELIMENIDQLGDNLTIFMIAHRKSTLKNCDRIFKLDSNKLWELDKDSII